MAALESVLATTSGMPTQRNRRLAVGGVAVVLSAAALCAPLYLGPTSLNLLGQFLAMAILAVGLDLIWGYTGILSLGQAVFFGIGGYLMAFYLKTQGLAAGAVPDFMMYSGVSHLPLIWEWSRHFGIMFLFVLIVPGLIGWLFGLIIFRSRIKGVYFSILTEALAVAFSTLVLERQSFTGGSSGLTNYNAILGHSFYDNSTYTGLYLATVVALILAVALVWWLTHSPFGALLRAVRDGENRLRFIGYNPVLFQAFVFAVAAALAGVAGALYVPQNGIITPNMLGVVPSITMVVWVAVGGRGTVFGAIIGALLVQYAQYYLSSSFASGWLYIIGGLFVLVVLVFPRGIVGLFDRLHRRRPI
ncbi:urea ABC transporter permease subunit UrtC [Acidihalobacter ferrooxydans]|nr:urea ABC transporter permease subunit UrtC [Acidihalobacter ferrooxydans]